MYVVQEAISEFKVYVGAEYVIVNAWSLDNVSCDDDDAQAYCTDGRVHMNPAGVLTTPHIVAGRVAMLRPAWTPPEIIAAVGAARARIRSVFSVREDDEGVYVHLHEGRLKIERATWRDLAEQLAIEKELDVSSVRQFMLDQGLATLATALCTGDW